MYALGAEHSVTVEPVTAEAVLTFTQLTADTRAQYVVLGASWLLPPCPAVTVNMLYTVAVETCVPLVKLVEDN
jgi:hypothetical protein